VSPVNFLGRIFEIWFLILVAIPCFFAAVETNSAESRKRMPRFFFLSPWHTITATQCLLPLKKVKQNNKKKKVKQIKKIHVPWEEEILVFVDGQSQSFGTSN
jgi:hypothetical protein